MIFTNVTLREKNYTALQTEILFNIASERAIGADLVRFDMPISENKEDVKAYSSALRIFKSIKKKGIIQLFVDREALESSTTEAEYLLNKYYDYISLSDNGNINCIYVRL